MVESILEIGYFILPGIFSNEWLMLWRKLLKAFAIDVNVETTCKTEVCSTDLSIKKLKKKDSLTLRYYAPVKGYTQVGSKYG